MPSIVPPRRKKNTNLKQTEGYHLGFCAKHPSVPRLKAPGLRFQEIEVPKNKLNWLVVDSCCTSNRFCDFEASQRSIVLSIPTLHSHVLMAVVPTSVPWFSSAHAVFPWVFSTYPSSLSIFYISWLGSMNQMVSSSSNAPLWTSSQRPDDSPEAESRSACDCRPIHSKKATPDFKEEVGKKNM